MGAHPTLATEEARGMRLRIGVLRQRVKANLPIEFVPQRLTSYGGLELIRRYFRGLDLLGAHLRRLGLPRLTIDVDGTVIRTGGQVAWAFRGFNPHQRKDPSYYPLLAHLAQTGQILDLRNRPGNVHDSRGAARFLSALITDLRQRLGRAVPLEFRMDAAFFQQEVLRLLQRR